MSKVRFKWLTSNIAKYTLLADFLTFMMDYFTGD